MQPFSTSFASSAARLRARRSTRSASVRLITAIETASPAIVEARNLLDRFVALISARETDLLDPWLVDAAQSEMSLFAAGLERPMLLLTRPYGHIAFLEAAAETSRLVDYLGRHLTNVRFESKQLDA